jgi:hypothetical protein
MTLEEKDLLLKDLSARLPYGVKIALKNNGSYHHDNVAKKGDITIDKLKGFTGSYFNIYHSNPLDWDWYDDDIDIEDIKPYLFPMSEMTEEQYKEYWKLEHYGNMEHLSIPALDWLNEHHFDYRGLIGKGLAIDATNKNIY